MIPALPPYVFSDAVRKFWTTRASQAEAQRVRGTVDQGQRATVTGGGQMHGFAETIRELLIQVGVNSSDVYTSRRNVDLPGFYRPTKDWDIVVKTEDKLLAAIELKSQVGPSFGDNFNNRSEEAIGSAIDLWTAYREGAFGPSPQPWLGFLFLLEDCQASRVPVALRQTHFKVFSEFQHTSYAQRYELLCLKLLRERQYNGACFLLADRSKAYEFANYSEPNPNLSAALFLSQLLAHVSAAMNRPHDV